ncbi:hypothetical protein VT98_11185 [Candidatus Electrothrix communis]|uniref:Uncharacterized protein n=1 Tax=Candidatus Electrothrix communis TaxID=1859133 RepID=A0A3S3QML1_9BACT|nr:hypothetical protein VT98_11185 [Candidatus Electrothrix communis]
MVGNYSNSVEGQRKTVRLQMKKQLKYRINYVLPYGYEILHRAVYVFSQKRAKGLLF